MSKAELNKMINEKFEKVGHKYVERVACYIRVSSQEQKLNGLSLDAQKMKLKEYAEKFNLKIVSWYMDEGVSGRKPIKKRPELQRMIKDAQADKFGRILFIKLDRYFRSVAEYHECQKILNAHSVTWTATEEKYDLTTANGRAFVNMKLTIAELEADQTGERISIVNDYKVKAGLPLYGARCLPFCYTLVQVGERKKVVKDPEYAELTDDLINHFLVHNSKRGALVYVNNKYGTQIDYNAIRLLMMNPLLCGMYRGNPNYIEEPYIDQETFERIQQINKKNIKVRSKAIQTYIFSGLLKCPSCGRNMAGLKRTDKRNPNNVKIHLYYRCSKHGRSYTCDFASCFYENPIERNLLEKIEGIFANEKVKADSIENGNAKISAQYDVASLQAELERLNYAWQKGRIKDVEKYDREYDELTAKIEEATNQHVEASPIDFSRIESILSGNWKDIYNSLDKEHRRAFWRSFIKSIEIDENRKFTKVNFF